MTKYFSILITFSFGLLLCNSQVVAQANDSTKTINASEIIQKEKKQKKIKISDTTKIILNTIKQANVIFEAKNKRYADAIELYKKAELMGSKDQTMYYRIGVSYFNLKEYKKSTPYFKEVISQDSIYENRAYYYLGRLYHLDYKFDSAITYFEEYYRTLSPEDLSKYRADINKKKKECSIAKKMLANPVNVFIDILDTNINTNYVEYAPISSTNDSLLIFTSRRPTEKGKMDQDGRYFEDVYYSVKDSTGKWTKAKNIGKTINKSNHDGAAGLSADGKKMVIYRSNNNGDLYISDFKEEKWSKPKKLNKFINTKYHEASASFSYDNLKLYFSSDKPGGYGGHDIYMTSLDEKGKWGEAVNLKAKVNSPYDEISMIALPDGKTFYYVSNGKNSMGGYDIFKITYNSKDSIWSDPENLGYPINTPDDDILYSITNDGKRAYIASVKNDSSKHDIYMITFATEIKTIIDDLDGILLAVNKYGVSIPKIDAAKNISKMNLTVLKGSITDEYTKEPLFAKIELTDNTTNQVVATFNSNESTGKYLVSLPSGKNYGISVKAEDCLFHSENINIKKSKGFKEIVKNIQLKRIAVGSKVVLENIFFASGKAKLTKSSKTELENLHKLLIDVPTLKLEISGHTDAIGKASSNKALSKRRAKAVVDYLVKAGISKERLLSKGYGEEKPIADNKTKEGRQKNRRTEFEVIAR